MISDVVTIGKAERKITEEWKNNQPLRNIKEARFAASVHDALDEIDYSYKVAWGEEYSSNETIVYLAYNIAIGRLKFEEVLDKSWTMRGLLKYLSKRK